MPTVLPASKNPNAQTEDNLIKLTPLNHGMLAMQQPFGGALGTYRLIG